MKFNINIWIDFKDQIIKFLTPLYEKKEKFLKESLNVSLEKKLTIKYNNKNNLKKETKQEENEKFEKIQTFIQKIERKSTISTIKQNLKYNSKLENLLNRTDNNFNLKNSFLSINTIPMIINKKDENFFQKPLTISENKFNSIRISLRIKSQSHFSTSLKPNKEIIKRANDSFNFEDSFNHVNTNIQKFTNPLLKKKKRFKKMDITEITQIDANLEDDIKKNNRSINYAKSLTKKFKSQKLMIVSKNVKNNLIEWKKVKVSNKFHSGNFDLPLYTFSK